MVFGLHIRQCRWCMGSLANTFQRCSWPARASNIKKKWIRGDQLAWISPDLLREFSHRNKLFKRHKRNPISTSWDDYKRQRNKVTSLKRNALKTFCCDASLSGKHPGEFWRKMKPLFPTSCGKNIQGVILGVWPKSLVITLLILFGKSIDLTLSAWTIPILRQ